MTTAYTPNGVVGYTLNDIINTFRSDGVRTGFNYYTVGVNPTVFSTNSNFQNTLANEGFFTGHEPRIYYTPAQAALLLSKAFTLAGSNMYGIEYKLRTEGFTTGDLMTGMVEHSPGDSAAVILGNLNAEGYVTGLQGIMSPSDPAMYDNQCADGRCMGSGCLAPTMLTVSRTPVGTSSLTFPALPYDAVVILMVQITLNNTWSQYAKVQRDGVTLAAPSLVHSGVSPLQFGYNSIGVEFVSAGDTPIFSLVTANDHSYDVPSKLTLLILKASC